MKQFFKKLLSATLTATMLFSSLAFNPVSVSAAPSISAGWNESMYAEWADSNPDSDAVKVGYKLSSDTTYTYLEGNDHEFLIRPSSTSGYARVDIPGLKAGRYDIIITASDGTVHERKGIKVYEYDRSGYAHFNYTEGLGAYKDDGTLKDNAIVIYVTDENKDTVEIPGYEGRSYAYHSTAFNCDFTRTCEGIGNILNNNMKFIYDVTSVDNHPLVIRFVGKVTVPKNLTPYNTKTPDLGGSKGDNGNLAITKYGKNITLEGIGSDAVIEGWGFTFSQTSTCPADAGKSFEVRNLTFDKYSEDGVAFQGDSGIDCPIERVWVHNNVFYPGYCANPAESDKGDGDGSCDFKRGKYYTMAYNKYIGCHKTNLVGSGTSDDQYYISLHHNWYQNVGSRQPLAANGNMHIYSTYFQGATSTSVDLRGKNCVLLEENYYDNCKSNHKSRNATCIAKSYNETVIGSGKFEIKGKRTEVSSLDEAALTGSGYSFPDGTSIDNFDLNPTYFYKNNYLVTPAAEVPEFVQTYAGTLKAFPETESGEIIITVTSGGAPVTDATVKANGLSFKNNGNGTYSATASLGAQYVITVSKEGYSNEVITSNVIENDGETFAATADLKVDYDGYAVVSLVGGSENTPVKGATVTLADGTVLADQNDGTYKSANQIAVGDYNVTITNTGDYIAPASAQPIVVKTTDEATEIHLDKVQGAVSVTLTKSEEETKDFDPSTASVYVGTTKLDYAGEGVFTGNVDINTVLKVSVNLKNWNVVSITPETLTASKEGTASAQAVMKARGDSFTWNHTDGTNTDNFFEVTKNGAAPDEWNDAAKNPLTYDGLELTKAIKFQSSTSIMFDAPSDGDLVIVLNDGNKTNSTLKVNGAVYPVSTGANKIPVTAGTVSVTKGSNETRVFLVQYVAGGAGDIEEPTDSTTSNTTVTTETTTETTTEAIPEETTNGTPVEMGTPESNNGEAGISVVFNDTNKTWTLTDTSSTLAATLKIPFAQPITSGKLVVKGTATPSAASSKWAFVQIRGMIPDATTAESKEADAASLATDASKMVTLRTDGATFASSTNAIAENKAYNYEFVIDMDTKDVTLKVDGTTYTGKTAATELTAIYSVTSVSGSRNVSITEPYVAMVSEAAELKDEIMWDVETDMTEPSNGLSVGETFFTNSEENGPVDFTDGTNTYPLEYWLQGKNNPVDENGLNPANNGTIPVAGSYLKFSPEADGAFTMAVKTNAAKNTYVTDETGKQIVLVNNLEGATRYDVVSFNVTAGKDYYIYAGGSKTCLYYIGYTAGKSVVNRFEPEEKPVVIYGDIDGDGQITATDSAQILQKAIDNSYKMPVEDNADFMTICDVDNDGQITATDSAIILQKAIDNGFKMPVEL